MMRTSLPFLLSALALGACTVTTSTPASGPPPARTVYVERPAPTVVVQRPAPVVVERPAPRPAPAAQWYQLGQLTVNGRADRDVINVGRYEGRFNKLSIRVDNSHMRMHDVVVVFTNGTRARLNVDHHFSPGESQTFDLPGRDRLIQRIEFRYSDLHGGGTPRVAVYGR